MIQYIPADAAAGRLLFVANDALLYIGESSAGAGAMTTSPSDLLDALGTDDVIQSVLGLLTSRGLGATPAFALANWTADSTLHVLVRGGLDVRVDLATGAETISGSGVSTWRETSVAAVSGFAVGDASADSSLSLPLGSGVVRSSGAYVVLDASAVATPSAGAHAASASAPAPVPAPAPSSAPAAPASGPAPVAAAPATPATAPTASAAPVAAAPATPAGMQWPPPSAPRPGATSPAPAATTPATPAAATPTATTPAVTTPTAAITPAAAATPPAASVAASPASIPTYITLPDSATRAPEHTIAEVAEVEPSGYEHLFEETVVRTIEDAAVRPADENDDASAADSGDNADTVKTGNTSDAADNAAGNGNGNGNENDGNENDDNDNADVGDHDGETIMSGDLKRGDTRGGPSDDAPRVPVSRQLILELSTGGREALTQPILVGRAPSVSKVSSGLVPRLVTIPGDKDISRNHAQFALEGDTVVVTDLHSRNGTAVILPGKAPQLLRQGEPTAVLVGTVIDLGGGVTLTVREEA